MTVEERTEQIKELLMAGMIPEAMAMNNSEGMLSNYDPIAFKRRVIAAENARRGDLTGYDCPNCLNRGYSVRLDEENAEELYAPCACLQTREALKNISKSGLSNVMDEWTFERFEAKAPWQISMKDGAQRYVEAALNGGNDWLFMSGQPGCGKTHLCTAVCGALLRAGHPVRYMIWTDESAKIKAARFDEEQLLEIFEPLKSVEVLYIDDLFKGAFIKRKDKFGNAIPIKPTPTDADIRLCYEIVNARYVRGKKTIITCEWSLLSDLMDVDEALFSRVSQRSKAFTFEVDRDHQRNYRLA